MFYEKKVDWFNSFLHKIRKLQIEERLLLPCIVQMFKLLLVNPTTISRAERSFSTARRIKFCMRSKMISVKFSAFSILRTHKTLTDNLNLKDIANSFCKQSKRRLLIFGRFWIWTRIHWLDRQIVRKQLDIMLTYHYV